MSDLTSYKLLLCNT
ncbi:hypothetical protein S40293_11586, partial [Stachybotrys chartarum IBT 40293]